MLKPMTAPEARKRSDHSLVLTIPKAVPSPVEGYRAVVVKVSSLVPPMPRVRSVVALISVSKLLSPKLIPLSVPEVPVRPRLIPFKMSPAAVPPEVRARLIPALVGLAPSPVAKVMARASTAVVVVA